MAAATSFSRACPAGGCGVDYTEIAVGVNLEMQGFRDLERAAARGDVLGELVALEEIQFGERLVEDGEGW